MENTWQDRKSWSKDSGGESLEERKRATDEHRGLWMKGYDAVQRGEGTNSAAFLSGAREWKAMS